MSYSLGLMHHNSCARSLIKLFILLFAAILVYSGPAYSASADDAKGFVNNLGKNVLSIINAQNTTDETKREKLREMFAANVDIDWMGQFVLGRAWQQAEQSERDSYLQAYRDYMLARYTNSFPDYIGADYTITEVKNAADSQMIVNMHVKSKQGQDVYAGYRLRPEGGEGFKVTDIIVENVSQITTQRAEFGAVVQQKGMAGLIKDIQAKSQQWRK